MSFGNGNTLPSVTSNQVQSFGAWVKEVRERNGMGQGELAGELGITQAHLSRVESGARDVSAELCIAFARAMRLPLVEVLHKAGFIEDQGSRDAEESNIALRKIDTLLANLDQEETNAAIELLETFVRNIKKKSGTATTRGRASGSKQVSHT